MVDVLPMADKPSLDKPYLVLMQFLGIWRIEAFATLNEAHDRAATLRKLIANNRYGQIRNASKYTYISVVWLLEEVPPSEHTPSEYTQ